jgi:adenylate cyclase
VGLEIERKFLVSGTSWRRPDSQRLSQGYLSRDKQRTVRVRIAGEQAFLTIKGETRGATRAEFEYGIPVADAGPLLAMCEGPLVEKLRHVVVHAGHTWEVDEFLGDNQGLVVAEIELASEQESFDKPDWVGREVTDDPRYYNANLAANPYRTWRGEAG